MVWYSVYLCCSCIHAHFILLKLAVHHCISNVPLTYGFVQGAAQNAPRQENCFLPFQKEIHWMLLSLVCCICGYIQVHKTTSSKKTAQLSPELLSCFQNNIVILLQTVLFLLIQMFPTLIPYFAGLAAVQRSNTYSAALLCGKESHKRYAMSCLFISIWGLPNLSQGGAKDVIVTRRRGNGSIAFTTPRHVITCGRVFQNTWAFILIFS